MIKRKVEISSVKKLIGQYPVTALLGPRQCGKTTLAREFSAKHYFDLENPRHLTALDNPQLAFEDLKGLIVIDEIQRKPELFPLLRFLVDTNKSQKYLILGSASRELIQQSSESLAGRIAFHYLEGFQLYDVGGNNWKKLWLRGGLPLSYLAKKNESGFNWLENHISTFLERDIPQLGIKIPAVTLRRFWLMLSHYHGKIINYSELGRSFGISDFTVKKYIEILVNTFMIRILMPWYANIGKRIVKHPKIYFTDSGILHYLLSIDSTERILGHPSLGASWEGFALSTVLRVLKQNYQSVFFWRTNNGAELDLFWQSKGKNWGIEFKFADAPQLTKSMRFALKDLNLSKIFVIYPGKDEYRLEKNIIVVPLQSFADPKINLYK